MNLSLNGLQENTIEAYNDLVEYLNKNKPNENGFVQIDSSKMDYLLRSLHNNLVYLGGVIDPETQKSIFEGKDVGYLKTLNWEDDEDDE